MEKLQYQLEKIDTKIDLLIAYYLLDEESYPVASIDLAVDTAITHPDLYKHITPSSLDLLLKDIKQVKALIHLLMQRGEIKKRLFRQG